MLRKLRSWLIKKLGGHEWDYKNNLGSQYLKRTFENWSKEDVINYTLEFKEKNYESCDSIYSAYLIYKHEVERLNNLLMSEYHTNRKIRHALNVSDLISKVRKLKKEITHMRRILEDRNKEIQEYRKVQDER